MKINIRKQQVGDIQNSTNVININGDLIIDKTTFLDIQKDFFEILRVDFEKYSAKAILKAKEEVNNFIKSLLAKLYNLNKTDLISKLQMLPLQRSIYTSLSGFVSSEDEGIKDCIIDLMVDRLEANSASTEAAIINEAISIIPDLNPSTLSLLAIMALRNFQILPEFSFMLEQFFHKLSPIVNNFKVINNLSIDHIMQKRCTKTLTGFSRIETLENTFLHQYDLYFRKKGSWEWLQEFRINHPEIMHRVNSNGTCMFVVDQQVNQWSFIDVNSKIMYNRLHMNGQDYLIPLIEELKQHTPLFSKYDIQEYFANINENWKYVFSIMDSEIICQSSLSSVGLYIGSKYISKYTGSQPLSITSYKL